MVRDLAQEKHNQRISFNRIKATPHHGILERKTFELLLARLQNVQLRLIELSTVSLTMSPLHHTFFDLGAHDPALALLGPVMSSLHHHPYQTRTCRHKRKHALPVGNRSVDESLRHVQPQHADERHNGQVVHRGVGEVVGRVETDHGRIHVLHGIDTCQETLRRRSGGSTEGGQGCLRQCKVADDSMDECRHAGLGNSQHLESVSHLLVINALGKAYIEKEVRQVAFAG